MNANAAVMAKVGRHTPKMISTVRSLFDVLLSARYAVLTFTPG